MQKISPFLWFDNQAEEAMNLYVSVFKNSRIIDVRRYPEGGPMPAGSVMGCSFVLDGLEFQALNAGPQFKFTPAISMYVNCETQAEVDELWNKLVEGGEEQPCGWLTDKFGLSWQIIPKQLGELMGDPNPAKAGAVMQAMMQMKKIDIAGLQAAYDGAG